MTAGQVSVVSIPPGAAFLPTLVEALLTGKLIDGFAPGNDPLALSNVTIWVPTRRAARALATEFTTRLDGEVALLPNIRALGDVDEDSLIFDDVDSHNLDAAISATERHLILSRLVAAWAQQLNPKQRELYQGAEIIMPSSLSDAIWFANDLAHLMDMVATEEVDWDALNTLIPEDHALWWNLTLDFLKIATEQWPKILRERGLVDATEQRAGMLRKQAQIYKSKGTSGPVIAAGSTGSIPATAALLKAISRMPGGMVVLPGLDRDLDDETWERLDLPDNDRDDGGTAPGHPQYGLKKLLSFLGIARPIDEIFHIGGLEESSAGSARVREQLISEALRPSHATKTWQSISEKFSAEQVGDALAGVTLIEAKGEREEALAIALALRDSLCDEDKTAALVTPDRNLARRVAVEMRRFGIPVDDSAGQPLRNRPAGTFARLVLQVGFAEPDPVALMGLLNHPLARFGGSFQRARHAARLFELAVLRGALSPPIAGSFLALTLEVKNKAAAGKGRLHRSIKRFSPDDWEDLIWLSERLDEIFLHSSLSPSKQIPISELTKNTVSYLEACAVDEKGELSEFYRGEDGSELARFLEELMDCADVLAANQNEWPGIFDALLAGRPVRPSGGVHSRVSILGPLEARLQTYDRVVLGGLNEKVWPATSRNDPFLSRPMKSALKLPPPERRTGLAAHDFQMLMGMQDVVLTRAVKVDDAPTIASRWVQRLCMVAGEDSTTDMRSRGKKYTDWAKLIDEPASAPKSCSQPRPQPPADVRPLELSITEIETWIADPYAIYARHILKLDALAPLLRDADARERGTLYHGIMEEFVKSVKDPAAADGLEKLLEIGRHHFDSSKIPVEMTALWWPRFKTIAAAFLDWHREILPVTEKFYTELYGKTDTELDGFTLKGRADRIDLLRDGRIALYDYKTGKTPYPTAVKNLTAPQLPLEAAMALRGAFGEELRLPVSELTYLRLRPEDDLDVDRIGSDQRGKKELSAEELAQAAWDNLRDLIKAYRDPSKDYRSKARLISDSDWPSDYDHLARVREWSVGDDGDDAA